MWALFSYDCFYFQVLWLVSSILTQRLSHPRRTPLKASLCHHLARASLTRLRQIVIKLIIMRHHHITSSKEEISFLKITPHTLRCRTLPVSYRTTITTTSSHLLLVFLLLSIPHRMNECFYFENTVCSSSSSLSTMNTRFCTSAVGSNFVGSPHAKKFVLPRS